MRLVPWIVPSIVLTVACGARSTPPSNPPPPPPPDAAPAAVDRIESPEFDVALAFPTGPGTTIDSRAGTWQVEYVDITHTDGRMTNFAANAMRGGSPLALSREMRDQLATMNACTQPEPAEFLGRDGARFHCTLGDGEGMFLLSSTDHCFWSVMITKRGAPEEFADYVTATLAKITVASGAKAPSVERCY